MVMYTKQERKDIERDKDDYYQIGKFSSHDIYDYRTQFYHIFGRGQELHTHRRKYMMKKWFEQITTENERVYLLVNTSHQIQVKDDKILQSLMRSKFIKQISNKLVINT